MSTTFVVQASCKQSPEPLANPSGLSTPKVSPKSAADRGPDHTGARYQQIEVNEEDLFVGAAESGSAAPPGAGEASESLCRSVQWVK